MDIVYDTTPPTITWSSVSNSSLSPQIIFQINDLRPGSISVTTGPYSSISCDPGANIHLSKDNFSSCIPFASDPVVGPTVTGTTEVRIQSNELEQDIEYQLRATTDFSDCAGNSMPTASTSQFRSMNAPPSLNTQITSSNNYTGYAKPGDNITISFVSTDALQGSPNNPKLTLSQLTPLSQSQNFLNPSSDNKTWIVSIKLDNTSFTNNTPQNGTIIHFLIDNYTDLGGLSGPNVTETSDGSYVIYDNQLPGVLSGGKLITDNSNYDNLSKAGDNISMNILTNEPLRSLTGAILGDNATSSNVSDDNWTLKYTTSISNVDNLSASLEFTMEDLAGNTGDNLSANTIAFDNTSPYVVEFQFDNGTIIDNSTDDNISLLLDGFKILKPSSRREILSSVLLSMMVPLSNWNSTTYGEVLSKAIVLAERLSPVFPAKSSIVNSREALKLSTLLMEVVYFRVQLSSETLLLVALSPRIAPVNDLNGSLVRIFIEMLSPALERLS